MKPTCFPIAAILVLSPLLSAQTLSTDIKQMYASEKTNLMRTAEKVPEEDYAFKPTPEVRTLSEVLEHVVTSQMHACGAMSGSAPSALPKLDNKAAIVSALKQSFDLCDKVFDSLTDSNASQIVKSPRGDRTKLGALAGLVNHDTEQYSILTVYMRLKGIVPPSSEHKR